MKKGTKKQNKKQSQLQSIDEYKIINIYDMMEDPDMKQYQVIIKLEDQLQESSEIVLQSFLNFYLKLVGLDQCNQYLKGMNLDKINLEEIISKLEQLQTENQQTLIDEEQCIKIENNKKLIHFFDTLFSTQTELPFECDHFFQYTFNWLTTLSQTKFRTARLATMEIISIIMNSILNCLEINENKEKQKEILQFINNIFEYLVTNRTQDIQSAIKKKSIQILFSAFLNNSIPNDPYYNQLGYLFLSENHECREASMIELEKIYKYLIERKKSLESILEFLKEEQEAILSLIFDPNESVQLRLINFLKALSQSTKIYSDFFGPKSCQAFIRILFSKNLRIRYDSTSILHLFEKPIKSVEKLVEFYLKYAPFELQSYEESFNFIISFIHSHPFITSPEQYAVFFDCNQSEIFQSLGLYFYASFLQYEFVYTKFWWLEETDGPPQYNDAFTNYFISYTKVSLDLIDENLQLPYLHIYANLNFKIIQSKFIKAIFGSAQKIFQKSQNIQVINQLCKMIYNCSQVLKDSEIVKDNVKEIIKYSQKIFKEKLTIITIQKIECLIKNNLVNPKIILNPFNLIFEIKDDKSIVILANLLASSLQNYLKSLLNQMKNQDIETESDYKEIRDSFYNYCFSILENRNKDRFHLQILQLIITNLIYTNNFKLQRLGLHQDIQSQTYSLLYMYLHEFLFNELIRQSKKEEDNINEIRKRNTHSIIDNLPQLNIQQMELLNNSIKLINQCPSILLNKEFGIQYLAQILELIKNHNYFRDLKISITQALQQSLQKVIENDQISKKDEFWKFMKNYSQLKQQQQQDDLFNEFVKLCINTYLTSVTKLNVFEKRMKFINNCAEMIQAGFQDIDNLHLFGLLNFIFHKPTKLLKVLQIDKLTYQKFYAFYESKSQEFHQSNKPEDFKKEAIKQEYSLRNKLKYSSGLTKKDVNKIVNQVQKSGQKESIDRTNNKLSIEKGIQNNDKQRKQQQQQDSEDDEEMEIPFSKSMIK
ncbi:unnamed protein product [Paramecium pentaurelia]|uniref:Uncharacterized protein n=1 Tax=Paramecium pentaurelia TaxID=43138 RepID=A0A8S1V9C8_9CILI|nr:unnamed protein product [Paramecium pentaurelia]